MGFGRSLLVLMWVHLLIRLRRFINTALDLISPLIWFLIIFALRNVLNNPSADRSSFIVNTEELRMTEDAVGPWNIIYHPDTNFTASIMDQVGRKMHLSRLDKLPGKSKGFYAYSDEKELARFIKTMKREHAVVIFEDTNTKIVPGKLKYTIRFKEDFSINSYKTLDIGPHKMFGFNYLNFMRLQWEIDSAYINMQGGSDNQISQTLSLQEFPYYKAKDNLQMLMMAVLIMMGCWLGLMLTYVFFINRLATERASGIQELLKMSGVSINTILFSHYLNALPVGLVYAVSGAVFLKVSENPLLPNSNGYALFLFLFLYFSSVVAMGFVICYILKTADFAALVAVVSYFLLYTPAEHLNNAVRQLSLKMLIGLWPHMPLIWFLEEIAAAESMGDGVKLSNLFTRRQAMSVFGIYMFLLLQIFVYMTVACYLARIRPGVYGQPLPWNFFWKKFFPNKNEVDPTSDEHELLGREERYFEKPPTHLKVGIEVQNVTKMFSLQHRALSEVSVNVYEGEITVLLGHNGAGKTTIMNIITGMSSPTSGKVFVKGLDMSTQQVTARKHIGLCPQHGMFLPDLTLRQHIMLFTMIKRGSYKEAVDSAKKQATLLGLESKLNSLWSALSGGMQRRAQLCIALAGDADVLILDEPTSGLDVETRRELWDLLLALRGSRTVLLSTHFMEEADALGDRVLALHHGQLRCAASTMHLKRAAGVGYRLSITTVGQPNEIDITKEVQHYVPQATIKEKTFNSISFSLPSTAQKQFTRLFTSLETKRSALGIDNIGVGVSTLEEVFLKLCSDVDTTVVEDEVDKNVPDVTKKERLSGLPLIRRQVVELLRRQVRFARHRKWMFLIMQVFVPIFLVFMLTFLHNNTNDKASHDQMTMNLDIYSEEAERRVLYHLGEGFSIRPLESHYRNVKFEKTTGDVATAITGIGEKDLIEYNKYLVGIELNKTDAKILYTTTFRHTAPVALNMLANLLASHYLQGSADRIDTFNRPVVPDDLSNNTDTIKPKSYEKATMWAVFVGFTISATYLYCVALPCQERASGARRLQRMAGCGAALYWLVTLLWHSLLALGTAVLPLLLALVVLERDRTTDRGDFLLAVAVITVLGSLALFAFLYMTSFWFDEKYCNIFNISIIFIAGLLLPILAWGGEMTAQSGLEPPFYVNMMCGFSWLFIPAYTFVKSLMDCTKLAVLNAMCEDGRDQCPNLLYTIVPGWNDADNERCCAGLTPMCYFSQQSSSIVTNVILLSLQFVLYMIIVLLIEHGVFNMLRDRLFNIKYHSPKELESADDLVRAERTYVEQEINKPAKQISKDSLLMSDLHKNYTKLFSKNFNAVQGVSLSVKKGECFGLLGVNGAGKTTTFNMVTGDQCVTRGSIFSNGHFPSWRNSSYLQTLSYCPQFQGVDMFLTGQQNINLLLSLRGIDKENAETETRSWIEIVGLEKYANRAVEQYSGGCQRRLAAAAALCVGADLTLLDEPSSGVDVAARRRLWAALRRALREKRSIIITSHSMEEMESLCARIAILVGGRVRALGSSAALRAAHASGHSVVFKLQPARDQVDGPMDPENLFKGKLKESFNCTLKDEHKTMLHYHINETMQYSVLFTMLEQLKEHFPNLIEDYSVSETTLEEVFLSFAKESKNPGTKDAIA